MIFSNEDVVNNVAKNLTFSAHRKLRGMLDKRSLKDITKRSTKNISFVLPSLQTYFISSLKSKLIIWTNSRSKRNTNCLKKSPKEDQFEALNEIFKKRTGETINIDDAYGKEFLTCVEGGTTNETSQGLVHLDNCYPSTFQSAHAVAKHAIQCYIP